MFLTLAYKLKYLFLSIRIQFTMYQDNQDKVNLILNEMESKNSEDELIEALTIVQKLISNIIASPFEPKYRTIKTTNSTIKSKVMNIKLMDQLFLTLGYTPSPEGIYHLTDDKIGDFLEGAPAIDYWRRLHAAKKISKEDYDREKLVIKMHKQQHYQKLKRQRQTQKLKQQFQADKQERKLMKVDQSKSKTLQFGAKKNSWSDIGVDLNGESQKKGQEEDQR